MSTDPGAARQGNFINYYQFNPADQRIKHIPKDLVSAHVDRDGPVVALDIGCNAGVSL